MFIQDSPKCNIEQYSLLIPANLNSFLIDKERNTCLLEIFRMSDYSLKLTVGDMTIEATARSQETIESLFEYALAKRKEIRNE